jgi:hypothetical protein
MSKHKAIHAALEDAKEPLSLHFKMNYLIDAVKVVDLRRCHRLFLFLAMIVFSLVLEFAWFDAVGEMSSGIVSSAKLAPVTTCKMYSSVCRTYGFNFESNSLLHFVR